MKVWSAFHPDLLPYLPQVPIPLLDDWLRKTAIDFCKRTKSHVVELAAANAVANQMSYAPTMPDGMALVEVLGVVFAGEPLDPISPRDAAKKFGDWRRETGTPGYFLQERIDQVMLVPAPEVAASAVIVVEVAARPADDATGVDDWFFAARRPAIVAGCLSALAAQDGQPWSNPNLAVTNLAQFEADIDRATTAQNAGNVRSRPRASRGVFC